MSATCSLYTVRKTCLCSPLRNKPLSGSEMPHFCVLTPSRISSEESSFPEGPTPDYGGIFGSSIFSFKGFFPGFLRSSLISFFNSSSYHKASWDAILFLIFLLLSQAFTWVESINTVDVSTRWNFMHCSRIWKRSVQTSRILKTAGIVFPKSRKVRNRGHAGSSVICTILVFYKIVNKVPVNCPVNLLEHVVLWHHVIHAKHHLFSFLSASLVIISGTSL